MLRTIKLLSGTLLTSLFLFSTGCKKLSDGLDAANSATIYVNGVQQPVTFASPTLTTQSANTIVSEIDVTIPINTSPIAGQCQLFLRFSPSAMPFQINSPVAVSTDYVALNYTAGLGSLYQDDAKTVFPPVGSFTITKNDLTARRIEGTLNNCVATAFGQSTGFFTNTPPNVTVTITGDFAINY